MTKQQEKEITDSVFGLHSSLINNSRMIIRNAVDRANLPKNDSNPLYRRWKAMMYRCYGKKFWGKKWYKDILVSIEWQKYENFEMDMGNSFFTKATLDRIDNKKGYSKENCKWSTMKEQSENRRTNLWLSLGNKKMLLNDWANKLGLQRETLKSRLDRGWSVEKTLTTKKLINQFSKYEQL